MKQTEDTAAKPQEKKKGKLHCYVAVEGTEVDCRLLWRKKAEGMGQKQEPLAWNSALKVPAYHFSLPESKA